VPANCISKFQSADVVLQRPLKCAFANLFKHWSAKEIRKQLSIGVTTSAITVNNSMDTVCKNAAEWLYLSWDRLRGHEEMIARGWALCGITKAWEFQFQNEAMRANFQSSLFGDLGNVANDSTNETEIPDFYFNMDVIGCLCYCVSTLHIVEVELPYLNETVDSDTDDVGDDVGEDALLVDLELDSKELEESTQATQGEFEVVWPFTSKRRD
jgi:hypothetical protein